MDTPDTPTQLDQIELMLTEVSQKLDRLIALVDALRATRSDPLVERIRRYHGDDGLTRLDIDDSLKRRLFGEGIDTIGALRLALKAGTLADIPGIGPKRIKLAQDALDRHDGRAPLQLVE